MAKRSKKAKAKKPVVKISGGWRLLKQSLADYRHNWRQLGGVALVAVAVNWLIRLTADVTTAAIYQGLWFVFVSCALIWVIRHNLKPKFLKLSQVYWTGTAPALKFLLVLMPIVLATVPFAIGGFIFNAVRLLDASAGSGSEFITTATWIVFATLSLMILARLLPALIIVTLAEIGPGQAIGLSWRTTRGHTWNISRRLLVVLGFSVIAVGSVGLLLAVNLNPNLTAAALDTVIFGLVMPVFYLFLFKLYQELT